MGDIVALRKEPKAPLVLEGKAKCLACKHEWVAITPSPVAAMFDCPACGAGKGVYTRGVLRDSDVWQCNCGCSYFTITPRGTYCPNCAAWQNFP